MSEQIQGFFNVDGPLSSVALIASKVFDARAAKERDLKSFLPKGFQHVRITSRGDMPAGDLQADPREVIAMSPD